MARKKKYYDLDKAVSGGSYKSVIIKSRNYMLSDSQEKLLDNDNPTSVDDYINNIYYFLQDYNDRYNNVISENEILDLCINSSNE